MVRFLLGRGRVAALGALFALLATAGLTGFASQPAFADPMPKDDTYTTPANTTLNVAAPGVLANDTDPDGYTLTAGMPTNPSHGSLVLNEDGSFTYKPNAGLTGNDTFSYMAHDGVGGMVTAWVTITVTSGSASLPTLSVKGKSVTEGAAGTTTKAIFLIKRSGSTAAASTVVVSTANGTATAGSDYKAVSNKTVTFAAGVTSMKVKVTVYGDNVVEPNETFSLKLSSPTGATISGATGTATIVNDD